MTVDQEISQLATELQSEGVVQRRAAVKHAATLLANSRCGDGCRSRIVDLLRDLLAVEPYTTVRDDAQTILANLAEGVPADVSAADRPFMIGVPCKRGHISYYDRRNVCSDTTTFKRERVRSGERTVERFYVKCQTPGCGEEPTVDLECGEYGR